MLERSLTGYKVLVVDDAIDSRVLSTRILEIHGARVELAEDGVEACKMAMASDYDVVIMDMRMPNMDGDEATKLLRSKGYTKPIVALSGVCLEEGKVKDLGFDKALLKSVDFKSLVSTVQTFPRGV